MTQRMTGYRLEYCSAPPGLFTDVCAAVPRTEGPISACRFARPKTHLSDRLGEHSLARVLVLPDRLQVNWRGCFRMFTYQEPFCSFTRSYNHPVLILSKQENFVLSLSILCRQAYQRALYSTAPRAIAASDTSDHFETATSECIIPHAHATPAIWTRYPRRCFLWRRVFRLQTPRRTSGTSR